MLQRRLDNDLVFSGERRNGRREASMAARGAGAARAIAASVALERAARAFGRCNRLLASHQTEVGELVKERPEFHPSFRLVGSGAPNGSNRALAHAPTEPRPEMI